MLEYRSLTSKQVCIHKTICCIVRIVRVQKQYHTTRSNMTWQSRSLATKTGQLFFKAELFATSPVGHNNVHTFNVWVFSPCEHAVCHSIHMLTSFVYRLIQFSSWLIENNVVFNRNFYLRDFLSFHCFSLLSFNWGEVYIGRVHTSVS